MNVLLVNSNRMKPANAPIGLDYGADARLNSHHKPPVGGATFLSPQVSASGDKNGTAPKFLAGVAVLLAATLQLIGAEGPRLLEGPGLAASYPGDASIAQHAAVLFHEDFEAGDLKQWDDYDGNKPPGVQITTDPAHVHGGRGAVQLLAAKGKGTGADLLKWFQRGQDRMFARWYCQFAEDYDQGNLNHTGGNLIGARDRNQIGIAGTKPGGTDRFSTGLEPWRDWKRNPPPGELMFYTYYPDMKRDPSGPYYGNSFKADQKELLERGRWYGLEIMVKVNTPDRADGEQAFWVDGKLKGHFTGLRWRTTEALKLNCFWLQIYIHDNAQTNRVWFDDVVVATEYIGPIKK